MSSESKEEGGPETREKEFQFGGLTFHSNFDSGNLRVVERNLKADGQNSFNVWLRGDCEGFELAKGIEKPPYHTWFYFAVEGGEKGETIYITIKNYNNKIPLFKRHYRPMVRGASNEWKRLASAVEWELKPTVDSLQNSDGNVVWTRPSALGFRRIPPSKNASGEKKPKPLGMELRFPYQFGPRDRIVFFAFCYPMSYEQIQRQLAHLETLFTKQPVMPASYKADSSSSSTSNAKPSLEHLVSDQPVSAAAPAAATVASSVEEKEPFPPPMAATESIPGSIPDSKKPDKATPKTPCSPPKSSLKKPLPSQAPTVTLSKPTFSPQRPLVKIKKSSSASALPSSGATADGPLPAWWRPFRASAKIYFHREVITQSVQGLNIDLLTVSSFKNITEERFAALPHLFPTKSERSFKFRNKPVLFLSARVHPGETPCSYVFDGFLRFILDPSDPRAIILRDNFVIKLVPILNPDGVKNGFHRCDTQGFNLNRYYQNPSLKKQPSIYAVKEILKELQGPSRIRAHQQYMAECAGECAEGVKSKPRNQEAEKPNAEDGGGVFWYCDLHAHANCTGMFMYGNQLPHLKDQKQNVGYVKLVQQNHPHLDFKHCNFNAKRMSSVDNHGMSKEGAGRVALYREFGMQLSYTLECNYNTGVNVNQMPALPNPCPKGVDVKRESSQPSSTEFYTDTDFRTLGQALAVSILDLKALNPCSRIPQSEYKNLDGILSWAERYITRPKKSKRSIPKALRKVSGI